MLSPTRDGETVKRFFHKTLAASHTSEPRVITVDKHAADPKAFAKLKAEGHMPESCTLRQVKYLNNLIEQDHRFIKRLTKPGMSFFSLATAWRTLQGFEMMHMLRRGQLQGGDKGDVRGQVALVATLFGVVASTEQAEACSAHLIFFSLLATQPVFPYRIIKTVRREEHKKGKNDRRT